MDDGTVTAAAVIAGAAVALVALVAGFGAVCYGAGREAGRDSSAVERATSALLAAEEARDAGMRASAELARSMAAIDGAAGSGELDAMLMRDAASGPSSDSGASSGSGAVRDGAETEVS